MRLLRILKVLSLIFVPIGLLFIGNATATPPKQIVLTSVQQELPITPSITLTVCPEGPPTCDFKRIQEAIEAAPETPPVRSWEEKPVIPLIKIAPGTYEENLLVLKNLWLQGAGRERTTVVGQLEGLDARRPTIFIAGSWPIAIGITGLTVEGTGEAIQVVGRVSGMIADNFIRARGDTGVGGIWITGALTHLVIDKNIITGGKNGIVLQGVIGIAELGSLLVVLPPYGVFIAQNEIQGHHSDDLAGGYGIVLNQTTRVWIGGNHIHDNDTGIFLDESTTVNVESNTLEENNGSAIWSNQSTGVHLWKNVITRNSGSGIELWLGSTKVDIEANVILSNGQDGIRGEHYNPPDVLLEIGYLQGNRIEHNQRYGINLDPRAIKLRCAANRVSSNQQGDYSSEELRAKCGG